MLHAAWSERFRLARRSLLERVLAEIQTTMGIAFESRVLLAELDLAGHLYGVLNLSEHCSTPPAGETGARVQAALRPTRLSRRG